MNQADTAWMLISTALVLLMTPALAFFYGGLVRSKNALNTMMMSFISLGFVGVLWAVDRLLAGVRTGATTAIGDPSTLFLRGVGLEAQGTIPHLLFMCYQGTFAIITAALISGAIVERMRFSAYVVFISLWALFVYAPGRALGLGRRLAGRHGRARLRRRDRRARQRRRRGAGGGRLSSASAGLPQVGAAAAQRAVHAARRRAALVRMVRLQRRQRPGRQRHRRPRVRDHDARARPARWWSGRCSTDADAASPPPSAPRRRSSSASSRSRRRPVSSGR